MKRDLKNPLSPTIVPSFRTAFSTAKKTGKKIFNWQNKNYTTTTAEELAKNMSNKNLSKAEAKAYKNTVRVGNRPDDDVTPRKYTDLQKSREEVFQSYSKESLKREIKKANKKK
tara:strand:- start:443 stop:784 length:342 start_codon:yes stop_codon:yes gene_type:complete